MDKGLLGKDASDTDYSLKMMFQIRTDSKTNCYGAGTKYILSLSSISQISHLLFDQTDIHFPHEITSKMKLLLISQLQWGSCHACCQATITLVDDLLEGLTLTAMLQIELNLPHSTYKTALMSLGYKAVDNQSFTLMDV